MGFELFMYLICPEITLGEGISYFNESSTLLHLSLKKTKLKGQKFYYLTGETDIYMSYLWIYLFFLSL